MNIKKFIIEVSLLLGLLLTDYAHADITAPDLLVRNTANDVLEVLKTNKSIENGDMKKIGKLVEEKIATKFDFDRMSKMVLGRKWTMASKEQQEQFTAEFRSLLVRIYSSALQKYRGQTIEYMPLRASAADKEVNVKTLIIQPGGPSIPIDYALEKNEDGWKVYDIRIDGVSLVITYRGQFSEEIKKNGIDGVIQKLVAKNKS